MEHTHAAIAALALLAHPVSAQIRVSLELVAPTLAESSSVYATGSHPALGNWNPAGLKLEHVAPHTWRATITLDRPTSIEYKFTLGSWDREAADSLGRPLANANARITRDTTLSATIRDWMSGPRPRALNGQVTGALKYHRQVQAEGLAARDLVVWLPPDYERAPDRRYPVLYMLDGQNIFDPATSSFGTDWAIDETVDSLIRGGTIPPLIVVGVNNTSARSAEYLPGGSLSAAHTSFVLRTVKPLIDATYRTRSEAASTWIGGSSAGGIAAFMLVWEHPDVFSRALAFSPAFQAPAGMSTQFDYIQAVKSTPNAPSDARLYIDIGGIGLEDQLRPGIDAMLVALRALGIRDESHLRFLSEPTAEHNELAWRRRFPAALVWLLH